MENSVNASELFLEIKGNCAFSRRGDYIFGFKIHYKPRYTQSENSFQLLKGSWDRALLGLPTGTIICKSDSFMRKKFNAAGMPQNNFIQTSTANYFDGREFLEHNGYVFFIMPVNDTLKTIQIRNPFVFPNINKIVKNSERMSAFKVAVKESLTILNRSKEISLSPLFPNEFIEYTYLWLNGGNEGYATDLVLEDDYLKADNKYVGMCSVTDEMAFPDNVSFIKKDDKFSNDAQNLVFHKGLMDDLGVTLPISHIYNQIIIIDDTKRRIEEIYKTQDNLHRARKFGHENQVAAKRLEGYIGDLSEEKNDGFKFVRGHSNVIFFSDTIDEHRENINLVKSFFTEGGVDITPYCPTGERLKNHYINSLFVNVPMLNLRSFYLVDLRVATSLFLTNGAYIDDEYGFYFQDRIFNKPIKFDFWDVNKKRIKSRNFGIISPTGNGKSVTAEVIQAGLIDSQDVVVVNIDLGRSYEKLSKLYDPKDIGYFRYEQNKPLGLNPFYLEEDELITGSEIDNSEKDDNVVPVNLDRITEENEFLTAEVEEITDVEEEELDDDEDDFECNSLVGAMKIREVSEIVWLIIKKEGKPSALEKTSMRKIVDAYYTDMLDKGERDKLSWPSFYQFVKEDGAALLKILNIDKEYFNLKEFIHAGSEFIVGGVYANVFKQTRNIPSRSFKNKKMIIFELDEIKDDEILLSLMLQIISETIARVIWSDKKKRGLIFFDEFAKTLHFPGMVERVSYYAQAIRKQNGALAIVLQSISQFPITPEAQSISDNLETLIILPTDNTQVITDIAKRRELTSHDILQIRSMKHDFSGERKFSEFFIKRGGAFSQVFRIELAPEVLLAFETEGENADALMDLYNKTGSMAEAITQYLNERNKQHQTKTIS